MTLPIFEIIVIRNWILKVLLYLQIPLVVLLYRDHDMMLRAVIFGCPYGLVTFARSRKPLPCMVPQDYIILSLIILMIWRGLLIFEFFLLHGKFILDWSYHYIQGCRKHSRLHTLRIKTSTAYIALLILAPTGDCATPDSNSTMRILKCGNRLVETELS